MAIITTEVLAAAAMLLKMRYCDAEMLHVGGNGWIMRVADDGVFLDVTQMGDVVIVKAYDERVGPDSDDHIESARIPVDATEEEIVTHVIGVLNDGFRVCDACGAPFTHGYYDDGTYYCDDGCLPYSDEGWEGRYEEGGESYYSEWYV